jgi:hypothetical protein
MSFFLVLDELILFLLSMCLMCQMMMSGRNQGGSVRPHFLDLSLCDTHLTRTLGGFPTVVSGLVEDLGD